MTTSLNFPEALVGLPTIGGYGIEPQDGVARTDMDSGPARQRRRWTTTPTDFPVTWKVTRAQLALFEAWYYHHAAEGAAWFNITLLSGTGLNLHEARFVGKYKAAPWNGSDDANAEWWRVTTKLEIRNRPILDQLELTFLLANDNTVFFDTMVAFTELVEFGFPSTTQSDLASELAATIAAGAALHHLVHEEFP